MQKIFYFLLAFLIMGTSVVYAQMRLPDANITLGTSANSTSGSNDNIGVDLYTGRFNLGIQLYHYSNSSTGLEHSISIKYNGGGGVKVDDKPSDIGANWGLDVGGFISCEINGLPDEAPNGWLSNSNPEPSFSVPSSTDSVKLDEYITGKHDGEFDVYTFSGAGKHGRFICGRNTGSILQIPQTNLKISRTEYYNYSGFDMDSCGGYLYEIKNENGVRYIFSLLNCLRISQYNEDETHGATKWFLTKIVSPNSDDSIVFNYTPIIQEHYSYNQIQYTALPPLAAGAATEFCQGDYPAMTLQRSRELILNSVVYTNGTTITFNRGYNRLDLATNTVLDNIRISNAGEEIGYKFNYEYVSCNIASSYPNFPYADYSTYGTSQELYTRLNLNSIKRFNSADTIPFYQFNYNPDKLPELTNTGYADIYGYATSVATGKNRIQQYNFQGISAAGGLNTPDQTAFTPMSLNKIILPTGGEVNVEYEPNTTQTDINGKNDIGLTSIEKVGGLRVKSITQTDGTGQANALTHWYKYVEADGSTSSGVIANFPMFGYKYTETLLPYNVYVPHTYHKIQDCAYGPYSWPSNVAGSPVDFLIRSKNPLNALINTHGSCVGYGRVEEYLGTYSNYTKKIVHRFTTPDTYPVPVSLMDNNFPFPYIPDVDYAWGLPLEIDEFSKTNQLLSKSVNTYSVSVDQITDPNFMGLKVGLKKFPANDLSCYGIKHFLPITGKVFLTNTAETVYFPVGKSMVNNTSFDYDVSKNILTHIHAKNAKDEDIRTDFYYPYQFTSTGAIALLNTADRIYQPIRTETWKVSGTGQLLAVSASELGVFDHVPRIARTHAYTPSQTISSTMWGSFNPNQVLQSPQYYTPFATAEKYDSRGNLEQKTLRGITNTTLWGYNKTFPVARVINAAYADVAYTSFEDDMFGWQLAAGASAGITSTAFNGKFGGYAGGGVTLEKNSLNPGKTYIVTLWSKFVPMVKADVGGSLTPITLTAGEEHNGWTFFKGKFSNASYVWVGDDPSGTNIDELRLYPDGAVMTTKTYNPLFGISSECDAASNIVYYEYDGFGRMKYKRDPDGNILEAYEYQIQQPKY